MDRPTTPTYASPSSFSTHLASLADELDGPTPVASEYGGPTRVGSPEPEPHKLMQDDDMEKGPVAVGEEEQSKQTAKELGWEVSESKVPRDEEKQQEKEVATAIDFPEGGWRAYGAVAGAVLVLLSTFGLSNSFGVFQAQYITMPNLSSYPPSTISWIGSVHLFLTFSSSLLSGLLFDKGWFRYQLAFGSLLWLFGMFMLSLSTTYVQIFLSHAVCLGIAVGACFGPCISCCATYFLVRRSLVVGCATAGAGMGAVIFPIMLNQLFPVLGFAATIRAVTYLMLGLLVIANAIMIPRRLPPRAQKPALPLIASFARERDTWLVCLGAFGCMIGAFIPLFYVVVYSKSHGVDGVLRDYGLSIINGVACIARITSGLLADRIGIFNTVVPFTLLLSVMVFAMLGATSTASISIFLVLFGVASGGFISLLPSCFLALATDVSEFGLRSGVGFIFVGFAALIGSPIAGALLVAAGGSYVAPCCFGGAMALLGCGCFAMAREGQRKKKGGWKV